MKQRVIRAVLIGVLLFLCFSLAEKNRKVLPGFGIALESAFDPNAD